MLPKNFFENHFSEETNSNLFVGMASDGEDDGRFEIIIKAKDGYFEKPIYVKVDFLTNDIVYKIFDGICHSKGLLFDLSDDSRQEGKNRVNPNVMYELGVALAIRHPSSILLIRRRASLKDSKKDELSQEIPFDIRSIGIHEYEGELKEVWLKDLFEKQKENLRYFNDKILEAICDSIDDVGYAIIHWGIKVQKESPKEMHFGVPSIFPYVREYYSGFMLETSNGLSPMASYTVKQGELRASIFRLIDLGILNIKTDYKKGFGYAYHWTNFGLEILDYIKVKADRGRFSF